MTTALREIRQETGESLSSVALRAGLEPALLSLVERGKRPNKATALKIAAALGKDPCEIWSEFVHLREW